MYIDRPRHKKIIDELKDLNVKLNLLQMEMYLVHYMFQIQNIMLICF